MTRFPAQMLAAILSQSLPLKILQFYPSPQSQARVRYLLGRLKSSEITSDESAELERLGQLEHMMQLIEARARTFQTL